MKNPKSLVMVENDIFHAVMLIDGEGWLRMEYFSKMRGTRLLAYWIVPPTGIKLANKPKLSFLFKKSF